MVLNAPEGYLARLKPGPPALRTAIQPQELRRLGREAVRAVKPNGLLWITYPKEGKSRAATDLPATPWWMQRDVLGELTSETGYKPVALVAIDDHWTALRFKQT